MGHLLSRLWRPRGTRYDPQRTTARLLASEPILGQDKYLGGELGADGNVYGIPGTARRVLRIAPRTGAVAQIGPEFPGELKWLRGILGGDGRIYGIPANADGVLRITPATGEVEVIGGPLPGRWKWHGGVLAGDGCIYGIPCNADAVLKIDVPNGGAVTMIGRGCLPEGKNRWYGGLLGRDGCIYGIPNRADRVLKIDPSTQEVRCIGPSLGEGGWKWHGGVVSTDGYVIGIPAHASSVLRITPGEDEVVQFGDLGSCGTHFPEGRYKFGGGVCGGDGVVFALPSDAERVLRIVPGELRAELIGPSLNFSRSGRMQCWWQDKWQNGYRARDGACYGIPVNGCGVLRIVPATGEVSVVGDLEGKKKWEGGVVAPDGNMYCMPLRSKQVLVIVPPGRQRAG